MFPARARTIVMMIGVAVVAGYGQQAPSPARQWPPPVQKVGSESPPLSPADALKTFFMPPGYHVELVASEPLIQDPVAIDFDPQGRLWAVEMPGYMRDMTGAGEDEPIGRVVVLEDADGDGRMDKRTVFADGLVLARSVKVLDRGVLIAEPPNVWLMRDTDGDLRADSKELVTSKYGRLDADPQNNANGFYWALDNRMYTAGLSDVYLRLKNGVFEVHETLQRGQWGLTQDDSGRIYRNTNESALHVDLVPTPYFARNPHLLRTRGSYERLANGNEDLNTVWPVRPNPGTNRAYQTGIDRTDGTLVRFTAVCAPLVYRGDRLPSELYGNVFVAEPAANLVSRIILDDTGTTVRARKAYERGEVLASTDERFRPVYLTNAPDGTLYIADMYRGILEHRISITVYLRGQILARKLEQPTGLGRIYRIVHDTTERDTATRLAAASSDDLVRTLSHPSGWWRDTAQRLLVERADRSATPALVKLATSAKDWRTRLQALWTLDGLDAIEPATVVKAIEDPSRDVRVGAVRIAERWLAASGNAVQQAVLKHLDDADWAVRQQIAASIGSLPPGSRAVAAVSVLERHGDDPIVVDATLSGLRGSEVDVLERVLVRLKPDATTDAVRLPSTKLGPGKPDATSVTAVGAAITMLAATIVRGAEATAVQKLFAFIADNDRPEWQKSALLHGAEVALLGAAMPGTTPRSPASSVAGLPCPTCPGGRAGPGGAYAFPRPEATASRANSASGPQLRLPAAPDALSSVARRGGDLGVRAGKVLARVTWPGKPGQAAPATPLTKDEQQRFEAGREIYKSVCEACHQADGRGREKLAPSLVGSAFALAPAGIPIRILLQGKDGPIGLMPPVGGTLNDEQIAGVLTYLRREWGQSGSPVDSATVKRVREETAGRTKPWTEEELRALGVSK